ncbi:hypothetical protein Tco_0452834 [Tanacetum coccineum]
MKARILSCSNKQIAIWLHFRLKFEDISARRHLSNEAHVTGVSFGQCHIEKVQGQSSLQRNHEQSDDMIVDWVLCFTIMIENNTKQLETDIQEQDKNKATK